MSTIIKPDKNKYAPISCRKSQSAEVSENCSKILFKRGNKESYVVFDMGEKSVGGYPAFIVKSFVGNPRLRISYSDRYGVMTELTSMRKGDFVRGCCKYLGVELPVLPANPGRFEEYSITREGIYVFPLIQGQERFIAMELIGSDCEAEIRDFCIIGTSAESVRSGSFECSDNRLNDLWTACADTLDLATIRTSTVDRIEGITLLRGLTQGENGVIRSDCKDLTDYSYEVRFGIAYNPHNVSGFCAYFRAPDRKNGYIVQVDLDGAVTAYVRKAGAEHFIVRNNTDALTDNVFYNLIISCIGDLFIVKLDGKEVLSFRDGTFEKGSFGFCQGCEKWAFAQYAEITQNGKLILCDDFSDLSNYEMVRTPFFISDGAKRDRLPWSGDIDWAFRSGYYSHGLKTAMRDTLLLFSRHSTPEGYVLGTFYPEYEGEYRKGEYGHYESDMFAGWYVISAGTYYKYTADIKTVKELYPSIRSCLLYFLKSIEADGLFNQRYETSKGLWDHQLGDFGKNSYTNLIIWECFRTGTVFAEALEKNDDKKLFETTSEFMRKGIFELLWSEKCGGFVKTLGKNEYCDMANPFAIGKELVSDKQAAMIARSAEEKTKGYGKILSLMINGLYAYGYNEIAYKMLTTPHPLRFDNGEIYVYVNWLAITDSDDFPHMTTECMHYPPASSGNNTDWGDLSHPDSGVNDILGGRILGIRPLTCGFKTFTVDPRPCGLRFASGETETPFGTISVKWDVKDGKCRGSVICPEECDCIVSDTADIKVFYRRKEIRESC